MTEQRMTDYDSPWKEALDLYFRAFLALLFPHINCDIEEGRRMPYATSVEREGMLKIIADQLRAKFGTEVAELLPGIHELNDAE
jgi:hypothetical protein